MQIKTLIVGLVVLIAIGSFIAARLLNSPDHFVHHPVEQVQEVQDSVELDPETQKALEKSKKVAQLLNQTRFSFGFGQYETALDNINEICKLEPDNVGHHLFRGDICFAAGKMKECVETYDEAIRLNPEIEPQLWQRGLALYYDKRFADGVKQFETHQTVNSQDVENAVWHLLCASRVSDVDKARKKLIPITGDERVPMSQIYEMFAGRMTPEQVVERAKKTRAGVPTNSPQQKLQLYYAHLYIGLYYEMLKESRSSIESLKKAQELNPLGKANFMGQVARVHLMQRGAIEPTE